MHYEQVGGSAAPCRWGETMPSTFATCGTCNWPTAVGRLAAAPVVSGVRDDEVAFTAACIRYDFIEPLTAGFFIDGQHTPVSAVTEFDAIAPPGVIPIASPSRSCTDGSRHQVDVEVEGVFEFDMDDGALHPRHRALDGRWRPCGRNL